MCVRRSVTKLITSTNDQESTLQLGDVLSFFTGADRLHPLTVVLSTSIAKMSTANKALESLCEKIVLYGLK